MTDTKHKLIVDKTTPGLWKVTFDNPPINLVDDSMYSVGHSGRCAGALEPRSLPARQGPTGSLVRPLAIVQP
jgi:hypothetical protein